MYCGTEIDADASFCEACGKSTSKTKECVLCLEQIPVNAKFCKHCGFDQNKDPWDFTNS
jgi:NMD protein affecting ribosome stability and mRNA decay